MKKYALWLAVLGLSNVAFADEMVESYTARLSANDHFNSSNERLASPAAVIRQDRANYHKFKQRDAEDEYDSFFSEVENREKLERLLNMERLSPAARKTILNGQPLVKVEVFRSNGRYHVNVDILSE